MLFSNRFWSVIAISDIFFTFCQRSCGILSSSLSSEHLECVKINHRTSKNIAVSPYSPPSTPPPHTHDIIVYLPSALANPFLLSWSVGEGRRHGLPALVSVWQRKNIGPLPWDPSARYGSLVAGGGRSETMIP